MKSRVHKNDNRWRLSSKIITNSKIVLAGTLLYSTLSFTNVLAHGSEASYLEKYRSQLSADSNDHQARKKYIHALQTSQHYDEALSHLTILRSQTPNDETLDFDEAFINLEKGDLQQANLYIDRFLTNQPKNQRALSISGRVKLNLGNYSSAINVLERTVKLYPKPDLYLYLADAYTKQGDHSGAVRSLEKGNKQLGNLPLFLNKMVKSYEKQGKNTQALKTIDRLIDTLGKNSRTEHLLVQKADLLTKLGQHDTAKPLYHKAYSQLKSRSAKIQSIAKSKQLNKKLEEKINHYKNNLRRSYHVQ